MNKTSLKPLQSLNRHEVDDLFGVPYHELHQYLEVMNEEDLRWLFEHESTLKDVLIDECARTGKKDLFLKVTGLEKSSIKNEVYFSAALIPCVESLNLEMAQWLFRQGADVNKLGDKNLIIRALRRHKYEYEIAGCSEKNRVPLLEILSEKGCPLTNNNLISTAIGSLNLKALEWAYEKSVKQYSADVIQTFMQSALKLCDLNFRDGIDFLLGKGCQISGTTVLKSFCSRYLIPRPNAYKFSAEEFANLEHLFNQDDSERTRLIAAEDAVKWNRQDVFEVVIRKGVDLEKSMGSFLKLSAQNDAVEMLKYLMSKNQNHSLYESVLTDHENGSNNSYSNAVQGILQGQVLKYQKKDSLKIVETRSEKSNKMRL